MAIKRMDLAWITTSDIKKAQKFFTETLGLTELGFASEHGWMEAQGKEGGLVIGIAQDNVEDGESNPGSNAVITFTVDSIEETMKDLQKKGVKFLDDIVEVPGHVKMVSFVDFDGNIFQLVENLNESDHQGCC